MTGVGVMPPVLFKILTIPDTVLLIWQPELVQAFIDPPSEFADSPPDLDENFDESRETVEDLCNRFPSYQFDFTAQRELERELQRVHLRGMPTQNQVGKVRFILLSRTLV
jgi:hypothetical protein